MLESVRKTGKCLIVYEDNRFGGYGAEVAAIVAEEAFDYLDGPVTRIAGPDVPGVPYNHVLEDWFMVDPEKIAAGIRDARRVLTKPSTRPVCGSGRLPVVVAKRGGAGFRVGAPDPDHPGEADDGTEHADNIEARWLESHEIRARQGRGRAPG